MPRQHAVYSPEFSASYRADTYLFLLARACEFEISSNTITQADVF
jgi:hypothetical protein